MGKRVSGDLALAFASGSAYQRAALVVTFLFFSQRKSLSRFFWRS